MDTQDNKDLIMDTHIYMTQLRDEGTIMSTGVTKKLKYIAQHFIAYVVRDLILTILKIHQ